MAGIEERFDEFQTSLPSDPQAMAAAIKMRGERLKRHNLIVRDFAGLLVEAGATIYEIPFDILALFENLGVLVEVKTLDGSVVDERDRVRDALSQVLYYEAFVAGAVAEEATVYKIACFESKISDEHMAWLNAYRVGVVWNEDDMFLSDELADEILGPLLDEVGEDDSEA